MAFWTSAGVEPKRNFRFRVQIGTTNSDGGEFNNIIWWAKTVTTPSFDLGETEHHYLGGKYYFPGKVSWSEVNLSLVDPISPDAVGFTNQILVNSGYMVPKGTSDADQYHTISKNRSIAAGLEYISIEILRADGEIVEQWNLQQPFIKAAKFGDLDYSNEDLRTVDLTIRYDWATCTFPDTHPDADKFGNGNRTYFNVGDAPAENAGTKAPNYVADPDGDEIPS